MTEGEKHSVRIKKLNAIKRNELFEDKYEESKEEREARQLVAEEKRRLIQQF